MTALYLIPCSISDNANLDRVLPAYNKELLHEIRHFIVEEVRTARRFLRALDKSTDIDALTFYPMGKHADATLFSSYLEPLRQGEPMGMISEAGCPAVADPGAEIVAIAQRENLRVVPLVGPSSILMAVMAGGLGGQSFAFNGYLPINPSERQRRLKMLEARARSEHQTQLFIETPYRNARLIADILTACKPSTRLSIAASLTTDAEYVRTQTVSEWKRTTIPDLSKTPTVFSIL